MKTPWSDMPRYKDVIKLRDEYSIDMQPSGIEQRYEEANNNKDNFKDLLVGGI